jgi:D-aminoacyl-tRNA deacylase
LRAVVQRVARARVAVSGDTVGEIGAGICVLLGVSRDDGGAEAERLAGRVARLRVFENEQGKFDRSLLDVGGAALVVSQFTLIADSKRQKGTRPDFSRAARPEVAEPLYEQFCQALRDLGVPVETGVFGARMQLEIVNDGPVTIVLDAQAERG